MSEGKKLGTRIEKKIIETPVKLSDYQIRKVSGGFAEYEGYAAGHVIICPNCGNEEIGRCAQCRDQGVKYECSKCGFVGP